MLVSSHFSEYKTQKTTSQDLDLTHQANDFPNPVQITLPQRGRQNGDSPVRQKMTQKIQKNDKMVTKRRKLTPGKLYS